MQDKEVINILQKKLNFTSKSIAALKIFVDALIKANKKHNFISKSTEADIWHRHVLDSAQLIKFIDFSKGSLSDLGTGAGFPGIVLAIFNNNKDFHVKLFEKSPVKRAFLQEIANKLSIKVECHFLNFLWVTPIAAPAIVNELYFPVNFLLFKYLDTLVWNLGSIQDKTIASYFFIRELTKYLYLFLNQILLFDDL